MTRVDVESVLSGLKGFQRDAVEHVISQFYPPAGEDGSRRFLVADETGLGKSVVARGVIARTIDHLAHEDAVGRIDIVYICSNHDLARQNLRRLNVTGSDDVALTTRLTLLATVLPRLEGRESAAGAAEGKKVNLVSFTPATSGLVSGGWRTGRWEERALLVVLLRPHVVRSEADDRTLVRLFRATMDGDRFATRVEEFAAHLGPVEPTVVEPFERLVGAERPDDTHSLLGRVRALVAEGADGSGETWERTTALIGELRQALARAGVDALEPDLVILDEFQRFRQLLADPATDDVADLAQAMFDHPDARVLLLSATPYAPFTRAGEGDVAHDQELLELVRFLVHRAEGPVRAVREAFDGYRRALLTGGDARAAADTVRRTLLPYMSRSERPQRAQGLGVRELRVAVPEVDDVVELAHLRAFGEEIGAPVGVEYWKSIPYFANFLDGYRPGERARERFGTPEGARAEALLASTRSLDPAMLERFAPLDPGNGYLRALQAETVDRGWWRMLWLPPSMPYLEPGPVYAGLGSPTKRLVFSAWAGVPTAVSALLSYAADREIAAASGGFATSNSAAARERVASRFTYRTQAGEVGALSTLALFWPHGGLAGRGDPLGVVRALGRTPPATDAEAYVTRSLPAASGDLRVWDAFFSIRGALPDGGDARALAAAALGDAARDTDDDAADAGVLRHVEEAVRRIESADSEHGHPDLARLALHAPGTVALRALRRIAGAEATADGLWSAAFALADGVRRMFDRPETIALLVGLYGDGPQQPYWSSVLSYVADGNLQAVLDEYLYQLRSELGGAGAMDDATLLRIARHVSEVLRLRPARYAGHDTDAARTPIPFQARFALRYGGRGTEDSDLRDSAVRPAFNSPFAPFVLVSTSVGQEGIDFHWWCHAVVHWNLPYNPVDLEQREGRVDRYVGHAVRRNVAAAHADDVVLRGDDPDPWGAAFELASHDPDAQERFGEFAPWWVYPGPARVERVLARYPLSVDHERYERLRDSLALYRLTLGQPRQEDMIELLRVQGVDGATAPTIDLSPPRRST